jgi:hypothetical protein
VPGQFERQFDLLMSLHGLLGDLEVRLGPVLESRPEKDEAAGAPAAPPASVLGQLLNHNSSLERACARVADLRDRLQL